MNCGSVPEMKASIKAELRIIRRKILALDFSDWYQKHLERRQDEEVSNIELLIKQVGDINTESDVVLFSRKLTGWKFFKDVDIDHYAERQITPVQRQIDAVVKMIDACSNVWGRALTGRISVTRGLFPGASELIGRHLGGSRRVRRGRRISRRVRRSRRNRN